MALSVLHETCQQYFQRRLREGWKCINLDGYKAVLLSPDGGVRRELDLRHDIETLRPNAAGDECNIPNEVGASCPNHYQNVDEEVCDEGTTEVHHNAKTTYYRDLYHLDATSGSGEISKITVYSCSKQSTGNRETTKICIKPTDTVYESAAKETTTSWQLLSEEWVTNPDDDEDWEWADLADLQAGISFRGGSQFSYYTTYCSQVYVEVDYTAGAPQSITISYIAEVATIQAPTLSGSGSAPIILSPLAAASSIVAPVLVGSGTAPITLTPIAVASSVVAPILAASGAAPVTITPISATFSVVAPSVSVVLTDLEGYRWRDDDGDEIGATWLAVQDTDVTVAVDTNIRLRTLINATSNPPSAQFQLEYRKVGEAQWVKVE